MQRSLLKSGALLSILASLVVCPALTAFAACAGAGSVVTCDNTPPNPWPNGIGFGPGDDNISVTLQSGTSLANAAQISLGDANAISLGNNANINIGENAQVTNIGNSGTPGLWTAGTNTIEFGRNSVLNIGKGALVTSAGQSTSSEAVSPIGDGNIVTNNGTIQGVGASAMFFENRAGQVTGTPNVVDNFGKIIAGSTGTAFGEYGNTGIVFTQETGALVQGNMFFNNGNNTLHIYTGSTTTGSITGGTGTNTLILDGEGTDTLSNTFTGFSILNKTGIGTWTLTGTPLSTTSNIVATVQAGKLILTGINSGFSGTMTVDPNGTLSGAAANLMPFVTDNGVVQFNQQAGQDQPYNGQLVGTGGVDKIGPGLLYIVNNQTYTGPTTVTQGTLAVDDSAGLGPGFLSGGGPVIVKPGATLTGYGTISGVVTNYGTVSAGSAVPLASHLFPFGFPEVGQLTIGGLNNVGAVNLAPANAGAPGFNPGNSLLVKGDYVGSPGSTLTLGTVLNAGGPLSNQSTDRLLIQGNATGSTSVLVNPLSAGGATGLPASGSTGISIVQVGGTSSPDAFTLPNGYITGGSPYLYHLNAYGPGSPNGPSDPSQNLLGSAGFWDFRLQSVYETIPAPQPNQGPLYRLATAPQVATYLTVGNGLASSQVEDLSELHRRLGEIRVDNQTAVHKPDEVFIRAYGSKLQYKTDQDFSHYGFNFSDYYAATQIGANHMLVDNSQGKLRAGFAGVVGHTWIKPSEAVKSKGSIDSQSVAALFTWESREEWYVDAILSGGLFSGPVTPAGRKSVTSLSGDTLAGSLEIGYPYDIGWNRIVVEPEVQMIYSRLKFSSVTDLDTMPVDLGKQSQRTLRLGARVFRVLASRPNMHLTSYAEGNVIEDLTGTHHVVVGQVPFTTGSFGDTIQLRGGVNGNISQRFSVYSDLAWQFRVSTSGFLGWAFNLGLRYTF